MVGPWIGSGLPSGCGQHLLHLGRLGMLHLDGPWWDKHPLWKFCMQLVCCLQLHACSVHKMVAKQYHNFALSFYLYIACVHFVLIQQHYVVLFLLKFTFKLLAVWFLKHCQKLVVVGLISTVLNGILQLQVHKISIRCEATSI